jgi:hypothetical protein
MRRSRFSRLFAVLVGSWFAVAANQPVVFGCTMAGGHGSAHHSAQAMAMAGMDMHGETPAPDSNVPHAPGSTPQDCCSGFGSCGGAAAVPTSTEVADLAPRPSANAQPFRADERPAQSASDVRLPFSNGPPSEVATA